MLLNSASLLALNTAFRTEFQTGQQTQTAALQRGIVATDVPSTTKSNTYGWLGLVSDLREWIGDRQIDSLAAHRYEIVNKPYEKTIGVDRDDIEDDNLGIYGPMFRAMGQAVAVHPEKLVWPLFKAGFSTACHDGQYFFDTDHPVLDENGETISVANTDGGAGTAWFCTAPGFLDTSLSRGGPD